jgi:glutathione synthase
MRFLFILDPLPGIKTYKDSTYAMMVSAAGRGHELAVAMQGDLALSGGRVQARCQGLALNADPHDWYRLAPPKTEALAAFDAVIMRKDPPFDMEYVYSTYLLELAEGQGARVFNAGRAIRDHSEKLAIAQFADYTVPFLVTRDAELLRAFHAEHGDVIFKPLDGMGGAGIFRLAAGELNTNVIIETLTANGTRSIMAQVFIPEITAGDKRILVIGGEPVPYSLARVPKEGETRGNLAAGGSGRAQPLSARDREIALAVGPELWRRGLLLIGIDVIGDWLTEINVTSPTCFQEITQQTGFDVAGMFITALERAVRER